ncbi:N-formylglutamate amidohydrolase [Brevundimonas sp.]|uniref:N-formylglutamate amidohydrolase n=1 Tax=Brevundimonas sp. TaxID=1871086 RepID=UPI002E0EC16D|nr:N-formylglutamate amidohydrolase [Brevundimonas sp.]
MSETEGRAEDAAGVGRTPATPWVFASPHSGADLPSDMRPAAGLSRRSLRSAEDALVDRLIEGAEARGAALLRGTVSRAYLDLNRDPAELDPLLVEGMDEGPVSPRAAAGYGIVPRLTGDGRPLYARRLSQVEVEARIAAHHAPYHAKLATLMDTARAAHGRGFLIDWHSMPAARGRDAPQVVIGDRHGETCSPALTRRLQTLFEAEGWRVALNVPYAGGWSTIRWGRPAEKFEAVQIELDRGLYLDAATLRPGLGWDRCKAGVERVIAALLAG